MFSIDVIKKSNILIKINFIYIQISTATSILLHLKSVTINPPPRISASLERGVYVINIKQDLIIPENGSREEVV